jgi:hypothetical protein
MRTLLPLAGLALLAAPLPAAACSVAPGYRVPTNMELVERAEIILLGTVTDGDFEPDGTPQQRIAVEPVAALKGAMPPGPIALPAMIGADAAIQLSNPYELNEAHPQSFAGACTRYVFPRGSRVLFFLDRQDGAWREAGGPFSRWAEDVLSDDAPWLQAIRFYVEVAELPGEERAAALAARRDELAALADDPVAQLLAADIARQLAGPNAPLRGEYPSDRPDATGEETGAEAVEAMADDVMEAAEAARAATETEAVVPND